MFAVKQPSGLEVFLNHTRSRIGEEVYTLVTSRLRDEPCVSFALSCHGWFDCSPELDVAVRLLSIAARNRPVDHNRLIWGLQDRFVTPTIIASGKQAVRECLGLLKSSGLPFEFLAHVEGESEIVSGYRLDGDNSRWSQIADALADEVGELA